MQRIHCVIKKKAKQMRHNGTKFEHAKNPEVPEISASSVSFKKPQCKTDNVRSRRHYSCRLKFMQPQRRTITALGQRQDAMHAVRKDKKVGSFHKSNAASNSEEYCKVATADRTPHWRVPPGYNVGDACKKEAQRKIAQEWKRICRESGYNDESWAGWDNY